jgi:rhodanese-related sulfurtransferase
MSEPTAGITQADFRKLFDSGDHFVLLDVRRGPAYQAGTVVIPGATWHDPESVADSAGAIPKTAPVIAYCVHGHEVSQGVARYLQSQGYDARYLEGGIDAWRAPAGPTAPKPD